MSAPKPSVIAQTGLASEAMRIRLGDQASRFAIILGNGLPRESCGALPIRPLAACK